MKDMDIPTLKREFESGINQVLITTAPIRIRSQDMMNLYDVCFKLCTYEKEQFVYDTIKRLVTNYCEQIKQNIENEFNYESLDVFRDEITTINKDVKSLIIMSFCQTRQNYIEKLMYVYRMRINFIRRIASYLERLWIPKRKLEPLNQMMMKQWQEIIMYPEMNVP